MFCDDIAERFLRKHSPEPHTLGDKCLVDFTVKDLQDEVSGMVDCETRCEHEDPEYGEEFEECVEGCEERVRLAVKGSVVVDSRSLEVEESTLPVSCTMFMEEGDWGYEASERKAAEVASKFIEAGCQRPEEGWMHPHEFVEGVEIEEEPAICYLHAKKDFKCRLPEVLKISGLR